MRPKKAWADPNREGRVKGKLSLRSCAKCGNTVQQTRILKSLNLCEYCVNELREKRDGIVSCRGCGKIEPLELKEHNGYCSECVCSACGKPDPDYVRKTGLCFQCAQSLGDFCRSCGKEAAAQVRKNKGYCDECTAVKRPTARHAGLRSKAFSGKETKTGNLGGRNRAAAGRTTNKNRNNATRDKTDAAGKERTDFMNFKNPKRTAAGKPGFKSALGLKKQFQPNTRANSSHGKHQDQNQMTFEMTANKPKGKGQRPFVPRNGSNRERTESPARYR